MTSFAMPPPRRRRSSGAVLVAITTLAAAFACTDAPEVESLPSDTHDGAELPAWCEQLPRAAYGALESVPSADPWFEVWVVAEGVYAIYEPRQFQEVISYVIVGEESALLFDTGMGIGEISDVVAGLTALPVTVLNSHTHPDHVGGNAEFTTVLGLDDEFSRTNAQGRPNSRMRGQVGADALCGPLPSGVDQDGYVSRPFEVRAFLGDGSVIDLGGRRLELILTPGHAPDALMLLDREQGLLFTGDSFYEGPIYLFSPGTDLGAYRASMERVAALAPSLSALMPGHNTPRADPAYLARVVHALDSVEGGGSEGTVEGNRIEYEFEGFSLLLTRPEND